MATAIPNQADRKVIAVSTAIIPVVGPVLSLIIVGVVPGPR